MTVQVTVRIADDAARFLDHQVAGSGKSRAEIITRALRREARRLRALHDAEIYAETQDGELDPEWLQAKARQTLADLD